MPLNLIPNQPFIFEQALPDQPCLNNDPNVYTQMVTADDTICVQEILTPCLEDVLCDPNMYELGADILAGSWTVSDGWTSADVNHIEYDGANYNITEVCFLNIASMVAGRAYKLSFEITSVTGAMGVYVLYGSNAEYVLYDALGTYDVYLINNETPAFISFYYTGFVPTASDTIAITINSFEQVTDDCWTVDFGTFDAPNWTYSYDPTTGQGKYCSVSEEGDITNTSAYVTDLNYHRVTLTITDSTAGGLEIILGGVYLGTTTGNGEFTFYGIPTSGNDLILRKVDSFDGCVSLVDVDDFGFFNTLDPGDSICQLTVVNTALTQESSVIAFELWDDRIIWCFNTSILQGELSPIEMDCNDNYQLKIFYTCDGENTTYYSTTLFRWNALEWDCTFIMSAYSDGYAFGFYFGSVTAPLFYLTQRLRILQFAPKYPAVGEEYLYSNGSFSRSFAQSGKVRQAWFDYVDEACHDVIRLQVLSDVLTLDSDVYFAPINDYEPEWDEHRYNLAQSRIDLVKEETLFNRSCFSIGQAPCTTNVVTIPPSTSIGYEIIGTFDLTGVTDTNFQMEFINNTGYATVTNNDATTLAGKNAILANMTYYLTNIMGGTIINSNIIYVAPILDITVIGTASYSGNVYDVSAVGFTVDAGAYPSNVIMLQPA